MKILTDFHFSRTVFCQRYKTASNAIRELGEKMPVSRGTMYKLFDTKIPDHDLSETTQQSVIDLINPTQSTKFYAEINSAIESKTEEIAGLKSYVGYYRYVRKNSHGRIVEGHVEIYEAEGAFRFKHWHDDKPEEGIIKTEPRHIGYVFLQGTRIHLLGIGPRYLRPAVTQVCEDISKQVLHGFVITVSPKARGAHLFAARFIMIHQSNPKYQDAKLDVTEILKEASKEIGLLTL